MSIESQAVLAGHVPIERVVSLLRSVVGDPVTVRDMQRPQYKIIEYRRVDGSWSALNLFLESWAAEDYADAFQGPSTFLTAEYSPQAFNLVRSIAAAVGGLARRTDADPWIELEPAEL